MPRHSPTTLQINRGLLAVLTAVIALAAPGCTGGDLSDDHVVRRQEIMGGTVDSENTAVVGILIDLGGGQQGLCSGTLIAPNLVLTAQHCVAALQSQYVVCGQAGFGQQFPPSALYVTTETNMPQDSSAYRTVSNIHVPPGGNDACGFDIALLELNENVPSSVTEPLIPRIDVPITAGETYTAVGYGHIGNNTGSGTRRQLGGREVLCGTGECSIQDGIESTEFEGTDGTCQGDSGGAPIDAQGRVLGALSRGPDGCLGSVYSSVDAWSTWLRDIGQIAADNGGYDAPFWVELGVSEVPQNDPDLDGIVDSEDNCPGIANEDQLDLDADGVGDECDPDVDGDGVMNESDNCPLYENPQQYDNDADAFGDACDQDDDNDGVMDPNDNCQFMPNAEQADVCYGDSTFTPTPQQDGDSTTQGGDSAEIILLEHPDSIHATGRACAGAANSSELASLFLFVPGLFMLRRRRWFL